jgi:hypothetical protein
VPTLVLHLEQRDMRESGRSGSLNRLFPHISNVTDSSQWRHEHTSRQVMDDKERVRHHFGHRKDSFVSNLKKYSIRVGD